MKNVKVEYFFHNLNSEDNTSNNFKLFQKKIQNNNAILKYNKQLSNEYNNHTSKSQRPLSTTIYTNNLKELKNKKVNEFLRQNIMSNINLDKNNKVYSLNLNKILEAFNANNSYKLINIHRKINGKNLEEFIIKNIISLPKIKKQSKFFLTKNSALIVNPIKGNKNINNNIPFPNFKVENNLKRTNNVKVLSSLEHVKMFKYLTNKNSLNNSNEGKTKSLVKNSTFQNNNLYDNNNKIGNVSYIKKDNNKYNGNNAIILKTITNYKLPYTTNHQNNNSLLHSYQQPQNLQIEKKIQYNNYNNLLNQKEIENAESNKQFKSNEKINFQNNNINSIIPTTNNSINYTAKINSDLNNNYFLKEEFLEKLNNVRKLYKEREIKRQNLKCYYYLILPGNASYLVEKCMNHRINWMKPYSVVSTLYNFKWQELSYGIDYNSLGNFQNVKQIVNHYENHFVISNKAKMFTNLITYCEKRKISAFKYVPFTIIFELKDEKHKEKEEEQIPEHNCNCSRSRNKKEKVENKYDKLKNFINKIQNYVKNYDDIGNYYNKENFNNYKKAKENNEINKNISSKEFRKINKRKYRLFRKINKRKYLSYITGRKKEKENKSEEEEEKDFTFYSDYFTNLIEDSIVPIYDKNKERKYEEENNLKSINKYSEKYKIEQNIIGSNTLIEIPESHFSGKNMWVVKAINLNRGMCIRIVNSYEQMLNIINKFKEGVDYNFTKETIDENEIKNYEKKINNKNNSASPPKRIKFSNNSMIGKQKLFNNNSSINPNVINSLDKNKNINENTTLDNTNKEKIEEDKKINEKEERLYNCNKIIIQKYIENPLLYQGRKCDMRIWVLLTHNMKVYVFKEGHLKTCSIEYNINSKDAFAHITNYSFQKYNSNFQKYEKGNEVPFYEFQKFLDEEYKEKKYNIKKDLFKQIKKIIEITMRSAKSKINNNHRKYQFEIFGYDFMMDKDFNLFLIEINTNPGLEESSPWIKLIVPRMLDDALRLTVDKLFETKYDFNIINKNKTKEEIINYKKLLNHYNKNIDINSVNPSSSINLRSAKNKVVSRNKDNDIRENINHLKTIPHMESEESCDFVQKGINKNKTKISEDKNNKDEENEDKMDIKNKKYISPFPVPGYNLSENLWSFVCDLNEKDPLDNLIDKDNENKKKLKNKSIRFKKKNKKGKKNKNKSNKKNKNNRKEDDLNETNE